MSGVKPCALMPSRFAASAFMSGALMSSRFAAGAFMSGCLGTSSVGHTVARARKRAFLHAERRTLVTQLHVLVADLRGAIALKRNDRSGCLIGGRCELTADHENANCDKSNHRSCDKKLGVQIFGNHWIPLELRSRGNMGTGGLAVNTGL
jgi:hypothetical protein